MFVYRIVSEAIHTTDLTGTGAYKAGGRWNSEGVYMLYTSENSSLAYLETLVHLDETEYPSRLFVLKIEVDDAAPVYALNESEYPNGWMQVGLSENKALGDRLMNENRFLAIKLKSAINHAEHNYLLNPLFPRFYDLVKVVDVVEVKVDGRFAR